MEGQSATGNSQHHYQSAQWSRLVRRNTLAGPVTLPNSPSSSIATPQLPPAQLLPILLPQQPSFHQQQLAHYNRLLTAGRTTRLQSSPLPPLLSAPHIQAVPGPRSGSTGGNTDRKNRSSRGGHGNKDVRKSSHGERALITEKETAATMPLKKFDLSNRPVPQHQNTSLSQQSSSVPSTPHQHARKFSFESRDPSPNATTSHSPRSAYSESNITLPSQRPVLPKQACPYETAMVHGKRRMAYSLGDERLPKLKPADIKSKLSEDDERKLSTDMRELYDRLLPTPQSEDKRIRLVAKLERLFNEKWPGHDIRVHVFGSSGNLLCTDESDVDICITTKWTELEEVCMIADLLKKSGMDKVICVSTAKVPIVKIFDPELGLYCDMNVNNTLALENTRMIKTYVEIDPRVRPLAMVIKYWTKQRVLNDAAFGNTLSSYTWICMIINFLQSRDPPVLPALHQRPHLRLPAKDGLENSFADDLSVLRGFGKKNKSTLGELLFQFFRFYGHEFDYEKLVISVRSGKQVSKVDKKWHVATNNMLCVEEPFNTGRNLGNTADGFSFRGLHLELRRAFDLISEGKLDECCEKYEFPKEEERFYEKAPTVKKLTLTPAHPSSNSRNGRGGRGGGGRHSNRNGSRRPSNASYDNNPPYIPQTMQNLTTQDVWAQQQAQAQLHNQLYTTYSVLQAQENTLRLQLYAQTFDQANAHAAAYAQSQSRIQGSGAPIKQQATDRNRTNSLDPAPLTAPIRPDMFFYPLQQQQQQYAPGHMYGYQTPNTNPSSPSMGAAALPDLRRGVHRSSVTNGSGMVGGQSNSSMRSHSQPAARSAPSTISMQGTQMVHQGSNGLGIYQGMRPPGGVPNFIADENLDTRYETSRPLATTPPEHALPREYVGYFVNQNPNPIPQHHVRRESAQLSSIPAFGDVTQPRRRQSTEALPQSIIDRLKQRTSRSPSPLGHHDRSFSTGAHSAPLSGVAFQQPVSSSNLRSLNNQGPLVANGSLYAPRSASWDNSTEGSFSEDHSNALGSVDSLSQASAVGSDIFGEVEFPGLVTPRDRRGMSPLVVNGSMPRNVEPIPTSTAITNGNHALPSAPNGLVLDPLNGSLRLSPNSRNRAARQNGGMSPLDIGQGQNEVLRDDFTHLSPVYETRTPSPTVNRKFEGSHLKTNGAGAGDISESPKTASRLGFANDEPSKLSTTKMNGHTRGVKSEGGAGGAENWQRITTKGKKKGTPTESKASAKGHPFGEKPPNKDSERKGG